MIKIQRLAGLSGSWFVGWLRRCGLYFGSGMVLCFLAINLLAGPGVVVVDQVEAEGPAFSDPGTLDVLTTVQRRRACPSETQRWVWRWVNDRGTKWHEGDGRKRQQAIPIASTIMPFLADDGDLILSIPAPGIPDPEHGGWLFRSVTAERCSFLPSQVAELFGARVFRSKDIPVNFVGAPHDAAKR